VTHPHTHTGGAARLDCVTLPDGTVQRVVVLSPDVAPTTLTLSGDFWPVEDPDCIAAYRHPSGLQAMQLRDGSYQVGHGDGPTLALACLAELRRLREYILDAAELCTPEAVAEYADALAEVLEVALS
jgi:hypothetical protein